MSDVGTGMGKKYVLFLETRRIYIACKLRPYLTESLTLCINVYQQVYQW
jgi:hypothetical protein